ncbi:MAG: glycoside hydrolase family 2 TIM barrel-domain containing protein [Bacteroidota bacterium]
MNHKVLYILFIHSSFFLGSELAVAQRIQTSLNREWKFTLDDSPEYANPDYDDKDWDLKHLPHDWAFEGGVSEDGSQGQGGGYHDGGVGWYRKTIQLDQSNLDKVIYLEFEGVYMNSEVWINGTPVGKRPYGYISFRYEISKFLKAGKNTIAVRVDNSLEPSARWYHPCGIYAPVSLIEVDPVHIEPNGIFVTTPHITPEVGEVVADVHVSEQAKSQSKIRIRYQVLSPDGKVLQKTTADYKASTPARGILKVSKPRPWSPESPALYTLITEVLNGKKVLDRVTTSFGFRTVEWKTKTGFWLNNKNVKIRGVCEHWEGGPVAGAWTKPMLRWKLQLIKDMGNNAVRPSHNPFPPMFYDLCDEIGLLVMDELFDGWSQKARHDYGAQAFEEWWQRDLTEWVKRDRNHPSIFVWSLGNETHGEIAGELVKLGTSLDSTRLFTSGASNPEDMQVIGINGGSETKSFIENRKFDKPFISTEAPHTWQTRGYYRTQTWWRDNELPGIYPLPNLTEKEVFFYEWTDPKNWRNRKQSLNSSYDNATVRISARKSWELVRDLPWHSGNFRWTGFDYYGESALPHGGWPFNLFMGGPIDVAGFKKDLYYFYQSQWTTKPMLHLFPHWTHPRMKKGTKIPVWVYSNADEVELFLNGKSLGIDQPGIKWDKMQCDWLIPYEEGEIEAVAYVDGKEVGRMRHKTAGSPVKLRNTVELLPAEDQFPTCYVVSSEALDSQGSLYPYASNTVYYKLEGDIRKISLENGNPTDQTSRTEAHHRAFFMGKTRAFLEAKEGAKTCSILIASIMGDKSLYQSRKITIDVERLALLGSKTSEDFVIKYTINGADPLDEGTSYSAPFQVNEGTTVKAVVLNRKQEVLITMSETFGEGNGLFWGDEYSKDMWKGRGINIAAESAELLGNAKPSEEGRRFKHSGFVTFGNQEGAIRWFQENDGEKRTLNIRIRYSHVEAHGDRPMELMVNDKKIKVFQFDDTGDLGSRWSFVNATIELQKGANYIELKTMGKSGPYVDELFID